MKRKLLFAALCALFSFGQMRAQTDVTSTYLTNPSFESDGAITASNGALTITGWTQSDPTSSYNNTGCYDASTNLPTQGTVTVTPSNGTYYLFFRKGWAQNTYTFTSSAASLPPGAYTLSVDYKMVEGYDNTQNNNSSVSISATNGNTTLGSASGTTKTNVSGGNAYTYLNTASWSTVTANFSITEETSTNFVISLKAGGQRRTDFVVDNVKLVCSPFATSSDYTALNTAISNVEGVTWGFDEGEYAPYKNVEVIEALAAAKAIDQTVNNSQVTVQALTTTLTSITANAAEVNAIFDGSFKHDYSGLSGNVQPIGWYRVQGTSGDGYNVRYVTSSGNAGLATVGGYGMFTKFAAYYGWADGYTLPLNANTYYTIGFKYGGWGDCKKDGYVTMTDPASTSLSLVASNRLPLSSTDANSNTESWTDYAAIFKTNDAGNYVLGLRKDNENQQSQYVYGDFVLKTTTVAEATAYYNTVKTAVEGDYDDSSNGGSEKTAFKTALDASVPSTVAEIMEAAANLYTLRDAYLASVATFDALAAELTHAESLGVDAATRTANTASASTTTAEAEAYIQNIKVAEYTAVTTNYPVDGYDLFIGSWTASNFDSATGQHWDGTGTSYYDKWNGSAMDCSISKNDVTLPAGSYVFMAVGRGLANSASSVTLKVVIGANTYTQAYTMKGDTGYGVETSGATNFSASGTYANNNAGRGWEWRYIPFTLTEETSVSLSIEGTVNNSWCSAGDTRLLTTSDNVAVVKGLLNAEIATATAIDKTTNVGEGVFQTPSSAVTALNDAIATARGVYDNSDATSSEVSTATSDLQAAEATYKATVNAPAAGTKYYIMVATPEHAKSGNAWLLAAGETSGNNPTGYTIQANNALTAYLSQAWIFTQVSGNIYNISMVLPEGEVYLTYGNLNGSAAGWNKQQIQATTISSDKGEFKIYAGSAENTFKIFNTQDNNYIDCQDIGNIYTDTDIEKELFTLAEAPQASVSVEVAAGKFATRIFPFAPEAIDGITFYSCAGTADNRATLVEVSTPAANVPYILKASQDVNTSVSGWGTATQDSYTEGYLTGVYTDATIAASDGSNTRYVLQTQENVQAFYKVDADFTAKANRCYLTVPVAAGGGEQGVKAFYLDIDGSTTAIGEIANGKSSDGAIYNLAGQRVNKAQKGIYIINGKKVAVK